MSSHRLYETPEEMMESRMHLKKMGERIRFAREKTGLSQYGLARKAGVSSQCISYMECGLREPMSLNVLKIAEALNCSTDYLLSGDTKECDFRLLMNIVVRMEPAKIGEILSILRM